MFSFFQVILTLLISQLIHSYFPASFEWGEKIIFVDITQAQYVIKPKQNGNLEVTSILKFSTKDNGFPAFVLLQNPDYLELNGHETSLFRRNYIHPDSNNSYEKKDPTKLRAVDKKVSAGKHVLKIRHTLKNAVSRNNGVWKFKFELFDISKNNQLLGKYLPSNLEFDHYPAAIFLKLDKTSNQAIIHNGSGYWQENGYVIQYPSYINSSSLFLYIDEVRGHEKHFYTSSYRSIDGRTIPMNFWFQIEDGASRKISLLKSYLKFIENKFGPWPHEVFSMVDSSSLMGGMEYAGAFYGKENSWFHEMLHSYIGRGVFPANGKALWIDEALVSYLSERWKKARPGRLKNEAFLRQYKYDQVMTSFSLYTSETPLESYTVGASFIKKLVEDCFGSDREFEKFVKWWIHKNMHKGIDTGMFHSDMSSYLKQYKGHKSFEIMNSLFQQYIF